MTTTHQKTALSDPSLFISPAMMVDIAAINQRKYRWINQPLWPQKNICFSKTDRTNRRKLIEGDVPISVEIRVAGIAG